MTDETGLSETALFSQTQTTAGLALAGWPMDWERIYLKKNILSKPRKNIFNKNLDNKIFNYFVATLFCYQFFHFWANKAEYNNIYIYQLYIFYRAT